MPEPTPPETSLASPAQPPPEVSVTAPDTAVAGGNSGSTVAPTPAIESGWMQAFNPGAIPTALAVVLVTIVLVRLVKKLLNRLSETVVRHRLVLKQVNTLFAFVAYALAVVWAFSSLFTLSSGALLALSGTIAVTVGLALKDEASSFMAGLSILTDKRFQVGDRISFAGFYGEVKEIGLRSVQLVTLDDNLVTIPSNKFLTDAVASANAGELDCMVVTKFYITPRVEHARAIEIVEDAVLASKYLYLGKPLSVLVAVLPPQYGQVVVELTAKAYVYDTRQEKAFASDVTDRVLTAFREQGIEMPVAPARPAAVVSDG